MHGCSRVTKVCIGKLFKKWNRLSNVNLNKILEHIILAMIRLIHLDMHMQITNEWLLLSSA